MRVKFEIFIVTLASLKSLAMLCFGRQTSHLYYYSECPLASSILRSGRGSGSRVLQLDSQGILHTPSFFVYLWFFRCHINPNINVHHVVLYIKYTKRITFLHSRAASRFLRSRISRRRAASSAISLGLLWCGNELAICGKYIPSFIIAKSTQWLMFFAKISTWWRTVMPRVEPKLTSLLLVDIVAELS